MAAFSLRPRDKAWRADSMGLGSALLLLKASLLHQYHFGDGGVITRCQLVEVHTGCQVPGVERDGVIARSAVSVHNRCDQASADVVHAQIHVTVRRKSEVNGRSGVKRVGVVLS